MGPSRLSPRSRRPSVSHALMHSSIPAKDRDLCAKDRDPVTWVRLQHEPSATIAILTDPSAAYAAYAACGACRAEFVCRAATFAGPPTDR